ncbi:response regulator transcription factor [Bradyrhizobium diazoefficiens]|uniref:response regulator transcription factor n=1 Tax=Bradyrhizobium diazoefficiens TaxID=1355477 RepID=UPI00190AAD63|nr:response regulator transcription factor [Bradyrhizobium diazoefficiens]
MQTLPAFPNRSLLSRRQLEVTGCLVHGLTNKEIARKMEISPRTVEDYRFQVLRKLGVRNTIELTRFVYQLN